MLNMTSIDGGANTVISGPRQAGKTAAAIDIAISNAAAGERVLYHCASSSDLRDTFDRIRRQVDGDTRVAKINLANGNERIRFHGGGEIVMVNRQARGGRPYSPDLHIIDLDQPGVDPVDGARRVLRTQLT